MTVPTSERKLPNGQITFEQLKDQKGVENFVNNFRVPIKSAQIGEEVIYAIPPQGTQVGDEYFQGADGSVVFISPQRVPRGVTTLIFVPKVQTKALDRRILNAVKKLRIPRGRNVYTEVIIQ